MRRRKPRSERHERVSENPEYLAYLRSAPWKAKRKRILTERGAKCEVCGAAGRDVALSLHHLTYVRLYDELDGDLLVTCASCHAGFHGKWGVVRAIGANYAEARTKRLIAGWKDRAKFTAGRLTPTKVESAEWQGYDPFGDASAPMSWHHERNKTPALKDTYGAKR